ncbi:MAG: hypothetical protein ACRD3D_03490 [Terriglobia bacterium]
MNSGILVPLGAFLMVVIIVAIKGVQSMRQRELQAHQELRAREMDHERRLKELEIEKARLDLEMARATQAGNSGVR